jgi:GNAT superfamily N-acetyltransferase
MFVAKASDLVVAYGRVLELAADEAGPGTPAGCYLSGVLVEPAWRGRGIATALTRARLRWAFARTGTVFYVTGADNAASLHLHAAFGFQEIKRLASERSAAGVDVLSQLERPAAHSDDGPFIGGPVDHGSEVRNPGSLPACSQPTGGTSADRMRQLRAWRAGLSFSAGRGRWALFPPTGRRSGQLGVSSRASPPSAATIWPLSLIAMALVIW